MKVHEWAKEKFLWIKSIFWDPERAESGEEVKANY